MGAGAVRSTGISRVTDRAREHGGDVGPRTLHVMVMGLQVLGDRALVRGLIEARIIEADREGLERVGQRAP